MTKPPDLLTSREASALLPPTTTGTDRRIESYVASGAIAPTMRAGNGKRAPLLFARRDVLKLRDQIIAKYRRIIDSTPVS
jgi:hypothetical protein